MGGSVQIAGLTVSGILMKAALTLLDEGEQTAFLSMMRFQKNADSVEYLTLEELRASAQEALVG